MIDLPITADVAFSLRAGDMVFLNGIVVTGRDKLHKFLFKEKPSRKKIPFNLEGSVLYHCGPIIKKIKGRYRVFAAGPTTSMRVEMYEYKIISRYGLRGVMGKGGMGEKTLKALKKYGCVYFQTIGGAAVYLAEKVKFVVDVWKLEEFGMTEAMWFLNVQEFPAIVTMDAHGGNLHQEIENSSYRKLKEIVDSDYS
ncbi:MAG: fumarate hydratase C-terminal domain-containing protein [Nitrospirae bacterium]|nr:fumarate hydratase C-terminal domain-containing protein [Nitrospirota bacterium]